MKVNQGNVFINPNEVDVKNVLYNIFSYLDTSKLTAERHVNEILNQQGKVRISSADIPTSMYRSPDKLETIFESDEIADSIMYRILQTVSLNFDLLHKKAILVFLISKGFHRTYNRFELVTEFKSSPEWDYNSLLKKAEENEQLNALIKKVKGDTESIAYDELQQFYEWAELNLGKQFVEDFKSKVGEDVVNLESSSMKETYFPKGLEPEIDKELNYRIDLIRAKSIEYLRPAANKLCQIFGIGYSTYGNKKNEAIKDLVSTYGVELMKYAFGGNN